MVCPLQVRVLDRAAVYPLFSGSDWWSQCPTSEVVGSKSAATGSVSEMVGSVSKVMGSVSEKGNQSMSWLGSVSKMAGSVSVGSVSKTKRRGSFVLRGCAC